MTQFQYFPSHCSFIIFPQILFDGFQADTSNGTIGNNTSLPEFKFVDILTAEVSSTVPSQVKFMNLH